MIARFSLALILAAAAATGGAPAAAGKPVASTAGIRLVALLADNTLVVQPLDGGAGVTLRLGQMRRNAAPASHAVLPGRLRGHDVVFVLVNDRRGSHVVAVDVASPSVVASFGLPAAQRYNGIALIPRRHVIYAFGNDPAGRAVAVRLDLESGALRTTRVPRTAYVFGGAVDSRERFLVVSYYGPRSTGADVVPLVAGGPRCVTGPSRFEGCLDVHGDVALVDGIVAATFGEGGVRLVRLDGRIVQTIPVPPARNHFVSMAVDSAGFAVVPGSCGYGGGIATVDFRTGEAHLVVPVPPRVGRGDFGDSVGCGDRAAFGPDSLIAITQPSVPVPQPDVAGRVVVWRNWVPIARVPVDPDPVDVALVRVSGR